MIAFLNLGPMEIVVLAVIGLGCPLAVTGIALLVVFLTKKSDKKSDSHFQE